MKIKTVVAAGMVTFYFIFGNFLLFGLVPFQLFVFSYTLFLAISLMLALLLSKTLKENIILVLVLGILSIGALAQFSTVLREYYDVSVRVNQETVNLGYDINQLAMQIEYMQKIIALQKISAESYVNISKDLAGKIETEKKLISSLELAVLPVEETAPAPAIYEEYTRKYDDEEEYDD